MRRWHLLNRLFRAPDLCAEDRCVLTCEQLETRENPAPVVTAPISPQGTNEDAPLAFTGSNAFSVFDSGESGGELHTATLTATNGTITVDESVTSTLTITNNGTAAVTITGTLVDINAFLQSSGFNYDPTDFYSGEARVGLLVNNPSSGESDSGSVLVQVAPVASPAFLSVNAPGEVWSPARGFAFPPGFVAVAQWGDTDGSETATITFQLNAADGTEGFALFAGGTEIEQIESGLWQVSANSPAALQSLLNSLTLVPPSGFTGRATLFVFGNLRDTASYPASESSDSDFTDLGFGFAQLRFFIGGTVALSPVSAPEGSTLDLGGRFVVSDPDELPGDVHVLSLSVPTGLFTFNAALVPAGMSAGRDVAANGRTTILLYGDIATINAFLATPGSLLYSAPDPDFSGTIPLTAVLTNQPGPLPPGEGSEGGEGIQFAPEVTDPGTAPGQFVGVAALTLTPVADHVFPSAADAVTNQDTPVAVLMALSALPTDPSETMLVVVEGVPTGASFNVGTNLGGGMWALSPSDLSGLVFTPPPGAVGVYLMTVKAIVTDTSSDGTTDTATESATFAVTVNPVAVTTALLPPAGGGLAVGVTGAVGSTPLIDAVSGDSGGEINRPGASAGSRVVLPDAFVASVPLDRGIGSAESRAALAPPGEGSLFAQPEAPVPSYGGGEKHPLPPVLPLDQTSPVAGFTESGGDSFALVDKLYRDAAVAQGAVTIDEQVVLAAGQVTVPGAVGTQSPAPPEQTVAVVTDSEFGAAAPPSVADLSESERRVWAAGGVVAGALVAWAWVARTPDGRFARAIRRFLHPARRPSPTETY